MNEKYNFISFQNLNETGKITEDSQCQNGEEIKVFDADDLFSAILDIVGDISNYRAIPPEQITGLS